MTTELMPHQREGVEFAKQYPKSIIAHGMRLGKTRLAITFAVEQMAFPAIVICPASLRWVWSDQIKLWAPGCRVQVLQKGSDKFKRGADFHIVSYEYITKVVKIPLKLMGLIIVDESHYLKNIEAARTQRIWNMIEQIPEALLMSGTLVPSRPSELYTSLRMVNAIKMDFHTYADIYCDSHPTPWGVDTTGASNLTALAATLKPFMHYRTKGMVVHDLPPSDRQVIALNLPLDSREKEFNLQELQRTESPIEFEGLTDLMVFIGQQKAPSVVDFVKETLAKTEKVVVFFQYHTTADILREGLSGYGTAEHHGGNHSTRGQDVARFQDDPRCRVILVQIKTAIGISLFAADTTVFAEASWVPGDLQQAEARVDIVHGTPQPTFHYYMTIHRSVDEHQLRRCLEKTDTIDAIMSPEGTQPTQKEITDFD